MNFIDCLRLALNSCLPTCRYHGSVCRLYIIFKPQYLFSIFSSVLWPKTFLLNQMLSSSGLNLTLASLGRWNKASTSGFRWERYALIVLTGHLLEPGMRIFSHLCDLHCHQCAHLIFSGEHCAWFCFI